MNRPWPPTAWRSFVLCVFVFTGRTAMAQIQIDNPPIDYSRAPHCDAVEKLRTRIGQDKNLLEYRPRYGYLPNLLRELHISEQSQVLVFSKTSFQRTLIAPHSPRAIYFNDDTYIGSVQGGEVLELSSIDPRLGAMFYTLNQERVDQPHIRRQQDDCLQCHASSMTEGVPGSIVRSVYPAKSGEPILSAGTFRTSYQSPLVERWGGWYVTGTHGRQRHMGNATLRGSDPEKLDREQGANVTDLQSRIDSKRYLTPHSDIVALMVLEHQTAMHNQITMAGYRAMLAREEQEVLNKLDGKPARSPIEGIERRYQWAADDVLKCLLFSGEAPLTDAVRGTSGFAAYFASLGPKDHRGRSLREFDLRSRLFKYPCSYLIYTAAFQQLPPAVKQRVYQRLWRILTTQEAAGDFSHLDRNDRLAIYEILSDTLPELPDYWRSKTP
jgi:hypothetical protein